MFYKQQITFLKQALKKNSLTKTDFDLKEKYIKDTYYEYCQKIQEYLNLNYSLAMYEYQESNKLKSDLDYQALQQEFKAKVARILQDNTEPNQTKKQELRNIKTEYNMMKRNLSGRTIVLMAVILTLLLLLASLLVNYLFYFKIANDGEKFTFTNKNHLTAFIFMCIGIVLILGFLGFIVFNTTKRIFLDKKENLFKISTIGFFGSFTDTIGVGSFVVTVAALNATNSVSDVKKLPGTLNIGLTIPNLLAGTLFVSAIQVELVTLVTLVIAAMVGAFCAAKIVNKVNKKFVALFVAVCLALAGILMILGQVGLFNTVGTKGLSGWKLAVGIIAFFIIGGLQSFGVGLYAPALAIVSLLGMETIIAFPIMTCAAGFALPTTAWTFHRDNNYSPKVAYGLLIGGVLGTVTAFFVVFVGIQGGLGVKMNEFTYYLKWFAVGVMYYAAFMLFKKYLDLRKENVNLSKAETENYYQKYKEKFNEMFTEKLAKISLMPTDEMLKEESKMKMYNIKTLVWT
ncbi:sulfite exporter TauE/SafE family protein [Spiroplasma sp. SV19]|uniref:sulfite exporter TauE/SafE family protein n=1 Tax=Spiroplasma sp. SV19 TaxID=2570468 RepID=UPI0024B69DFB|nr:sulfite exporter TauE/SafE family protein [Spiroplasma sp. SV19]